MLRTGRDAEDAEKGMLWVFPASQTVSTGQRAGQLALLGR